mgnify:CR=1 FL=1
MTSGKAKKSGKPRMAPKVKPPNPINGNYMKEALHPVSLDGAVDIDAPLDFNLVMADDPSARSPFVYTIPAASLALAACGGGGGGSAGSGTAAAAAGTPRGSNDSSHGVNVPSADSAVS